MSNGTISTKLCDRGAAGWRIRQLEPMLSFKASMLAKYKNTFVCLSISMHNTGRPFEAEFQIVIQNKPVVVVACGSASRPRFRLSNLEVAKINAGTTSIAST